MYQAIRMNDIIYIYIILNIYRLSLYYLLCYRCINILKEMQEHVFKCIINSNILKISNFLSIMNYIF